MMHFGNPQYLYALFLMPAFAVFLVHAWKKKRKAMEAFADTELGDKLSDQISRRRQKIKNMLLFFAVFLLLFSLARPQYGYRWEEVKRRGVDVMIAVDLSKSMLAEDVSPSRIERARRKIIDFLKIAKGDRIGLIGFAGRAFVLTPLTLDYDAVRLFADSLEPDLVPVPGTAVAEAIELAIRALAKGSPESKGVILMSDGEDLAGDVGGMASKAAEEDVKIYTLGIGTAEGAPIPLPKGGFQKDGKGEMVLTRLGEKILISIAEATGGKYVRSVTSDRDIEEIYKGIQGGLTDQEFKESRRKVYIDRFQYFLIVAFILLALEAFMRETRRERKGFFLKKWFGRVVVAVLILASANAYAFGIAGTIRNGERLYNEGKYDEALKKFLDAQVDMPDDMRLKYNIANTYYKLGKYEEAKRLFGSLSGGKGASLKERSLYNKGNSEYRMGELEGAVKSYENALKIDQNDEDARYNLEFVKKQLEQQKQKGQQDQKQGEEQKGQQDQKQREEQKEKEEGEGEKEKEKEKGEGAEAEARGSEGGQQKTEGEEQKADGGKMSREEAERWLSTAKEGKRKSYSRGTSSSGKHKSEKDW